MTTDGHTSGDPVKTARAPPGYPNGEVRFFLCVGERKGKKKDMHIKEAAAYKNGGKILTSDHRPLFSVGGAVRTEVAIGVPPFKKKEVKQLRWTIEA